MRQSRPSRPLQAGLALLALITIASAWTGAEAQPVITLEPIITGLTDPLGIVNAGDGRLFIVLQEGRILVWDGTAILGTDFLNITSLVTPGGGERGLLGLAFHPNYPATPYFYVYYTDTSGNSQVVRYQVSGNPNVADTTPANIKPIISVTQPPGPSFTNHKAGQLNFGPDGYLYIALGDGGSSGDPGNRAQNLNELLGKILRIDVDTDPAAYAIPPTNPFVGQAGLDEIWAYGLRNPWRFTFDRLTGDLFIADVGQGAWEEVNFQPAGSPGGQNYGWNVMEGNHCFPPGTTGCESPAFMPPILEYDHSVGCSITGGYRYRGSVNPSMSGFYFYGDFCSGRIWAANQSGGAWTTTMILDSSLNISTFGEDATGEIYVADLNGTIYRITTPAAAEIIIDNAPAGVSDTSRTFTGAWCVSGGTGPFGADSLYSCGAGLDTYTWTPNIPAGGGTYDVYVWWSYHPMRSTNVPITVTHAGGSTTVNFNEQTPGGTWVLHGRYSFSAGTGGFVRVSDVNGQAAADAVRFVSVSGPSLPTVTIGATTPTATEAGPSAGAFTVSRSGSTGSALTVNYTVSGTATPGSDYTALSGSVVIPAGSPSAPIPVMPVDDPDVEPDETVIVTLSANAAYTVGSPSAATVTIVSNDMAGAEIILDNLPAGAQDTARSFTGTWCVSGGSARFGADSLYSCGAGLDTYTWRPTIPAGGGTYDVYVWWSYHSMRSTTVPITVMHAGGSTTLNFNEQNPGGMWVLHGRYGFNGGTAGFVQVSDVNGQAAADAVRLVPVTGPLPTVTIAATTPTATEAGPSPGAFTVSRSGSTASALTVSYTVSGTATPGSDYTTLSGTVLIPAGSPSAPIPVTPVDDFAVEPDETVIVTLSANAAYTVGAPSAATVTIVSNDVAASEIILDNLGEGAQDAARSFTGTWCLSGGSGRFGPNSLYSCSAGLDTYTWRPTIPAGGGPYDVYVWWSYHPMRSTNVPITVMHAGGSTTLNFNEQNPGGMWVLHGRYGFNGGTAGFVQVSDVNGQAAADAVRFVPVP